MWKLLTTFLLQEWNIPRSRSTVLYLWKNIKSVKGGPQRRYLSYTNELDCLTHRQVNNFTSKQTEKC